MSATSSRWEPARNPIHRLIQCLDVLAITLNRFHQCSFRLPHRQEGKQYDPDGSAGWFEGRARLLKDFEAVRDAVCTLKQSEAVGGFGQLLFDEAGGAFTRLGAFDEATRTTVGEAAEWVNQVVRSPIAGIGPTARPWDYDSTQPVPPGHPRRGERFDQERQAVHVATRFRTALISALVQAGGHVPNDVRARKRLYSDSWQQADPVTQDELLTMARATNPAPVGDSPPVTKAATRPAPPTLVERVEAQVCQIRTVPPPGLDSDLAAVYTAVTVAVRECARLQAMLPALWTDGAEYRRLAASIHAAADAARTAYDRVDMRLRRAGRRNVTLDVLNDVLTVRGRAPLDPRTRRGGLNGVVTRLLSTADGLFADVDGRGIFDQILDQLANVPPTTDVPRYAGAGDGKRPDAAPRSAVKTVMGEARSVKRGGRPKLSESTKPAQKARGELYRMVQSAMTRNPRLRSAADLLAYFKLPDQKDFRQKLEGEVREKVSTKFFRAALKWVKDNPDSAA
ncbi:MAG: hypothetical protein U0804_18260 [Gemmataceae bacterium]